MQPQRICSDWTFNFVIFFSINFYCQALPPTVESRCEVKRLHAQLQGAHADAEYGLDNIKVGYLGN